MTMTRFPRLLQLLVVACSLCNSVFFPITAVNAAASQWIRVNSAHFSVLTDAGEKKGHEVLVRFEQMRAVFGQLLLKTKLNMSQPLEIIALKSDGDYEKATSYTGRGFFMPAEDRNYIALNLSQDESWRAVSHQFAHLMLDYNYPPTQGWFDEGFAEYFSSLRLDNKQMEIGDDPELTAAWQEDLLGRLIQKRNPPKPFTELLSNPVWLALPDLFSVRHDTSGFQESTHHTLFYAQSWIVVHYLLNKNKLPETGAYFDLVQNQKVPVEQAIQRAYGMTSMELDKAVKDYFHSLTPLFDAQDAARSSTVISSKNSVYLLPLPLGAGDVGTSMHEIPAGDALALLAEMEMRLPERREQALRDLSSVISQPKTDNAIAHRALGWDHFQRKEFSQAMEELQKAMAIDPKDPAVRYDLCLVKYHSAQSGGHQVRGLANMLQDLQLVIDWDPQFAEAYNMLAMARLDGGGANSASAAERQAIELGPRNVTYLLNLAHIEEAARKWDLAAALLEHLKTNADTRIARAARKDLENLPTLQKYGVLPQNSEPSPAPEDSTSATPLPESARKSGTPDQENLPDKKATNPPAEPMPDKRALRFLKGTLISVSCEKPAIAVLKISAGTKLLQLRTENYKSLTLVGAEEFSCQWSDRMVSVNYRAGGKTDGDLVSVEIQ